MGCCKERTTQQRARVSAIIDIVLAVIGITGSATDLNNLIRLQEDASKTQIEKDDAMKTIYMICVVTAINLIKLVMGYTLWMGTKERDHSKCRSWLIVSIILWILQLASFVVKLSIGAFVLTTTITTSLAIFARIFAMKAVHSFVKELIEERKNGGFVEI